MKVALIADMRPLETGFGIARYDNELYRGMREQGLVVSILSFRPLSVPFGEALTHAVRLPLRVLREANDFDIVHATAPVTGLAFPLVKALKVVTYHDLIALLPESGASFHRKLFAPSFFRVGLWSDRIIANSSQTNDELSTRLRFPQEKLSTIPLGVGSEFRPYKRTSHAFFSIGYVGALAPRKRLDYLINTMRCLKENHSDIAVKLLIYGKKSFAFREMERQVNRLHLEGDVTFTGFVPQEKLVEAYNSLDVFVFPSEWEGFGLPILEAQRCGVPVVTREGAHIPPEVAECAVKTGSPASASDTIYGLLTDDGWRRGVIEAGLKHSRTFTWEKTVNETVRLYEDVFERRR